jgi:hypothetical protein
MENWAYEEEDLDLDVKSEILRNYFYGQWLVGKAIEKSWFELTYWEVAQIERDFEAYQQEEEERLDPENYYCTAGTR